jgi:ATPase subunit of ABC transporter with duplicated ATPase domains
MSENNVVLRFDQVNFGYSEKKIILDEASFSLRKGAKMTLMGQNGAGKSTLFKLIQEIANQPMGLFTKLMMLK